MRGLVQEMLEGPSHILIWGDGGSTPRGSSLSKESQTQMSLAPRVKGQGREWERQLKASRGGSLAGGGAKGVRAWV